ncbi:MAG TPA: DNA alkylation repair protein [Caulobacteraceae bacterium]|nr:DNA alkylation repair protein [Caulobacteraceae bacterium]
MPAAFDVGAEHAAMVERLRAAARPYRGGQHNDSYTGSGRPFFNVGVPERRRLIRTWLGPRHGAAAAELLAMADRLFGGESHEEKTLGALLLGYSAPARRAATPAMVEDWLARLDGWAEVDSLCASVFGAQDMIADWTGWRVLVERLGEDPDIDKRRAALVLLTTPTRTSNDARFAALAFETIERLKGERDIRVTKALSWLLRSMAARHAPAVGAYVDENASLLPAIAVRETRIKLATGTKSGRPARPAAEA